MTAPQAPPVPPAPGIRYTDPPKTEADWRRWSDYFGERDRYQQCTITRLTRERDMASRSASSWFMIACVWAAGYAIVVIAEVVR